MTKKITLFALLLALAFSNFNVFSQQYSTEILDKKVDSVLALMTLEEKIGQLNLYNGFWDATGPVPEGGDVKYKYENLKKGLVGGVLNVHGVKKVLALQKVAVEETRLGIPLIFGQDVIHGHKTLFPIPLAEAASWDLEWIQKSASYAAKEAAAMGLNWTFAPMVDISRDARWGRVMEGAGEDPYLGSLVAEARVKGFQGDVLSSQSTIAACAKHFAGYGFATAGRDYNSVDVSNYELYNTILPPFKAAEEAGVKTFMNAFNTLNGIPATADSFLLRTILKGDWGFKGFVVSDWGSVGELVNHGFSKDLEAAAYNAIKAGSDMDMEASAYLRHLSKLVNDKSVNPEFIDDAVRRILRVKFELGLFDNPYLYCNLEREKEEVMNPKSLEASLEMAKRSIVLLKNNNQLLPLNNEKANILIIGDLADDKSSLLGSWRLAGDDNTGVSVLEGCKNKFENIEFVNGPKIFEDEADFLHHVQISQDFSAESVNEAIQKAQSADIVIAVMGEHGFQSGEGRSRTDIGLPGRQLEFLKSLYEVNKNIILVLLNGRPLAIPWITKHIPAIVEGWQLGHRAGDAIADVLFGDYNPSGKLPVSFPRSLGQVPLYYNSYSTGRRDSIPLVFWSHYTDELNTPLYPFGYGLSYTTFKYENLKAEKVANAPNTILVSVEITNTGQYDGEEVAQLYIRDQFASVVRPVKELKGFKKFALKQGEKQTITFELREKELGFYMPNGNFVVEKGAFDIMVGTNSKDVLSTTIEL